MFNQPCRRDGHALLLAGDAAFSGSPKYLPDYPSRPFASKDEACDWVTAFVDWYNHRHRHTGIKFLTPHQRHSGAAKAICQQRSEVYETARRANPSRCSRSAPCWRIPEEV